MIVDTTKKYIVTPAKAYIFLQYTLSHLPLFSEQTDDNNDNSHFDNSNAMVRAVSETAANTEGVIGGVSGNTITVLWNASKKCRMHTLAGLSFAAQVCSRTERFMRVGVATGSLLHGNIGTQKNRFSTTAGLGVDAADAMADYASRLGVFCVFCDCLGEKRAVDISLEATVRLIDLWQAISGDKKLLRIYELDSKKLITKLGMWEEDELSETLRSRDQYDAIVSFCAAPEEEKLERLRVIAETHDDEVLRV